MQDSYQLFVSGGKAKSHPGLGYTSPARRRPMDWYRRLYFFGPAPDDYSGIGTFPAPATGTGKVEYPAPAPATTSGILPFPAPADCSGILPFPAPADCSGIGPSLRRRVDWLKPIAMGGPRGFRRIIGDRWILLVFNRKCTYVPRARKPESTHLLLSYGILPAHPSRWVSRRCGRA